MHRPPRKDDTRNSSTLIREHRYVFSLKALPLYIACCRSIVFAATLNGAAVTALCPGRNYTLSVRLLGPREK